MSNLTLEHLSITASTGLTTLAGLENIGQIGTGSGDSYVSIENCPQLRTLNGLQNVRTIWHSSNLRTTIRNNPVLQDLEGLRGVSLFVLLMYVCI